MVGFVRYDEAAVGLVSSALVSALTYKMAIRGDVKSKLELRKWYLGLRYFFYYWLVAEVKAHKDVVKRILSPSMPISPGIVKVPYAMKSDLGITSVANSITNTPGTIVVEIKEGESCFYVHWINVVSTDPEVCRGEILSDFEKRLKEVFS